MSHRTSLCVCSLILAFLVSNLAPLLVSPAAGSTSTSSSDGFFRLRGGLVFPDRDGEPGPGWLAGGALGLALNPNVSLSVNYDHLYLDVPDEPRSVDPLTLQLEFAAPYERRVTPRAEVGAGFYNFGSRDFPVVSPLRSLNTGQVGSLRQAPFGMNFGAGLSVPLWARTMFDMDLRYHQTMGPSSLVMGTVGAGLTYRLGRVDDGTWATAHTAGVNPVRR